MSEGNKQQEFSIDLLKLYYGKYSLISFVDFFNDITQYDL
jgi:hypothetical protein